MLRFCVQNYGNAIGWAIFLGILWCRLKCDTKKRETTRNYLCNGFRHCFHFHFHFFLPIAHPLCVELFFVLTFLAFTCASEFFSSLFVSLFWWQTFPFWFGCMQTSKHLECSKFLLGRVRSAKWTLQVIGLIVMWVEWVKFRTSKMRIDFGRIQVDVRGWECTSTRLENSHIEMQCGYIYIVSGNSGMSDNVKITQNVWCTDCRAKDLRFGAMRATWDELISWTNATNWQMHRTPISTSFIAIARSFSMSFAWKFTCWIGAFYLQSQFSYGFPFQSAARIGGDVIGILLWMMFTNGENQIQFSWILSHPNCMLVCVFVWVCAHAATKQSHWNRIFLLDSNWIFLRIGTECNLIAHQITIKCLTAYNVIVHELTILSQSQCTLNPCKHERMTIADDIVVPISIWIQYAPFFSSSTCSSI